MQKKRVIVIELKIDQMSRVRSLTVALVLRTGMFRRRILHRSLLHRGLMQLGYQSREFPFKESILTTKMLLLAFLDKTMARALG